MTLAAATATATAPATANILYVLIMIIIDHSINTVISHAVLVRTHIYWL